ncbi:MAG: ArnT family glycosyltransferase [Anaerolineae bacterium]
MAIVIFFACLALIYSVVNPILESPDEIAHYGYIQHLAAGNGLPVQRVGIRTPYEQEGSQPPLYYVLSTVMTGWIDVAESPLEIHYNPQVRTGIALAQDNHNTLVHSAVEKWPWRGEVLRIHLVRALSILMGASTVWGTYRAGRILFPRSNVVALGGMAFVALNPQFVYMSASINNDNLITCLATWTLVSLLSVLRRGPTLQQTAQLGVLIGLACLAKVSGLALVPLAVAVLAIATMTAGSRPAGANTGEERSRLALSRTSVYRWAWHTALALTIALAIAGWWYLRNRSLYGEFTGIQTMLDIFGRRHDVYTLSDIISEYRGFRISYWGLFGSFNVIMRPLWVYGILEAIAVLGGIGVVRRIWSQAGARRHAESSCPRAFWYGIALLGAWIAFMHISLLQWTLLTRASQGRLVFPAIAASSLLMCWGLCAWFPERLHKAAVAAAVLPLFILALAAPWSTIAPAYAHPPRMTVEDIPESAVAIGNTYEDAVRLVAVEQDRQDLAPGETITVTLYWQALKQIDEDLLLYVNVLGRRHEAVGQRDSYAGMGVFPTSMWLPGEVIRDRYAILVDPQAETPVAGQLTAGLYRQDTGALLSYTDGIGRPTEETRIGYVKLVGPGLAEPPPNPLDYAFASDILLLGYEMSGTVAAPGDTLSVALYWRTAPQPEDYSVFVHLVTPDGDFVGQGDGPPMDGEYPTSFWGSGERILDEHEVRINSDAPSGAAEIRVGLYATDGTRLPVTLDGQPCGDQVSLGTITISGP